MDIYASLKALLAIGSLLAVGAFLVGLFRVVSLRRRHWRDPAFARSTRNIEIGVLVVAGLMGLSVLNSGAKALESRIAAAEAAVVAKERAQAAEVTRQRLAKELQAQRGTLVDDIQRKVAAGKMAEARSDLQRYAVLGDPQVTQMIGLLDKEIEISGLLAKVATDIPPLQKARVYERLVVLAPGVVEYQVQAKRQGVLAQKAADELSAKAREQVVGEARDKREGKTGRMMYLLARVAPGRELYLASDETYIGTIVDIKTRHLFANGMVEPAILVLMKSGALQYIPRATAVRIYKTPELNSDRPAS